MASLFRDVFAEFDELMMSLCSELNSVVELLTWSDCPDEADGGAGVVCVFTWCLCVMLAV